MIRFLIGKRVTSVAFHLPQSYKKKKLLIQQLLSVVEQVLEISNEFINGFKAVLEFKY